MKNIIVMFFAVISLSTVVKAQQVSLYDSEGVARAYIDYDEDVTIFMWNGTPVAFIERHRSDLCIFGFNGNFLGWYDDGIIYDAKGYAAGAKKGVLSMMTKFERLKGIQRIIPFRPIITQRVPMQPILKSRWGNTSLTELLYFGKK